MSTDNLARSPLSLNYVRAIRRAGGWNTLSAEQRRVYLDGRKKRATARAAAWRSSPG